MDAALEGLALGAGPSIEASMAETERGFSFLPPPAPEEEEEDEEEFLRLMEDGGGGGR